MMHRYDERRCNERLNNTDDIIVDNYFPLREKGIVTCSFCHVSFDTGSEILFRNLICPFCKQHIRKGL